MPETPEIARLVRKQMIVSAVINAVLSAAIFVALSGRPGGMLTVGAPNQVALDFLPQCAMVGLMSALVPPFVARREFAAVCGTTLPPTGRIVATATGLALASLALGGVLAAALLASPLEAVDAWHALASKAVFGGVLGALVTMFALRPMTEIDRNHA